MSNSKAFTLIEIIIFIVVFTLGVVGIMTLFYNTLGKTSNPVIRSKGIQVAQAVMEEIYCKKWDEKTPNGGGAIPIDSSSIGQDPGENSINDFDDVDDYVTAGTEYKKTGTWQSEDFGFIKGFKIDIIVTYADIDSNGNIVQVTSYKTNYKMIKVNVSSDTISETYSLVLIKANF